MSEAGAKVLNAQAVQFAKESKIAIYARSTFKPGKETIIREAQPTDKTSAIAVVHEMDVIRIIFKYNIIKSLLDLLESKSISVKEFNYLQENAGTDSRNSFVISKKNIHSWDKTAKELIELFKDNISIDNSLGAVSLIGEGFSRDNKIITDTLAILSQNNVELFGVTTTSFRLSVLIKKELVESTVALLHNFWIDASK
jgi:aspartate kinase